MHAVGLAGRGGNKQYKGKQANIITNSFAYTLWCTLFFVNTHSPIPFDSVPLHSFFMFLFFNERF